MRNWVCGTTRETEVNAQFKENAKEEEKVMLTIRDYNYRTKISQLEARLKIATDGANAIVAAAKELGEKHNIPEEELSKFINGIYDLQDHLESK